MSVMGIAESLSSPLSRLNGIEAETNGGCEIVVGGNPITSILGNNQ